MTNAEISQLSNKIAETAMKGACEYVRSKGLDIRATFGDCARISNILRRRMPTAIDQAQADSKLAYEAGMKDIAVVTYMATIKLAGIAAAKELLGETEKNVDADVRPGV
jgi:hypothetical protein